LFDAKCDLTAPRFLKPRRDSGNAQCGYGKTPRIAHWYSDTAHTRHDLAVNAGVAARARPDDHLPQGDILDWVIRACSRSRPDQAVYLLVVEERHDGKRTCIHSKRTLFAYVQRERLDREPSLRAPVAYGVVTAACVSRLHVELMPYDVVMGLVILTGASGSGKTAIADAVASRYAGLVDVYHFDHLGVPPLEQMLVQYGFW